MTERPAKLSAGEVTVRPLRESDLDHAQRIIRVAFGTFIGVPEPDQFMADRDFARTRWTTAPGHALGLEHGRALVGSNFATVWGSVGFFGPLTVRPDYWNRGVAQHLLASTLTLFEQSTARHVGLYTFAHSQKHIALYQKYGFWPRFLTAIMSTPVTAAADAGPPTRLYSEVAATDRAAVLADCRVLTNGVYEGLDLSGEIEAVAGQHLGDTVLLHEGDQIAGLAVCHCGPGTEAGADACFVKFGAVAPGPAASVRFTHLVDGCMALGRRRGLSRLDAGVNVARHKAYRCLLERGFRITMQGVSMHRPNEPGYSHADAFVIDDWR